jgi:hypothetical protein
MMDPGNDPGRSAFSASDRPVRKGGVLEKRKDKVLLLLDNATGAVHSLNDTAALIWKLSDGSHTVGAIVEAVQGRYGVSSSRCREDVTSALGRMSALGLVTFR